MLNVKPDDITFQYSSELHPDISRQVRFLIPEISQREREHGLIDISGLVRQVPSAIIQLAHNTDMPWNVGITDDANTISLVVSTMLDRHEHALEITSIYHNTEDKIHSLHRMVQQLISPFSNVFFSLNQRYLLVSNFGGGVVTMKGNAHIYNCWHYLTYVPSNQYLRSSDQAWMQRINFLRKLHNAPKSKVDIKRCELFNS